MTEYTPLPSEFLATGIFGFILFTVVFYIAIYSMVYHSKTIEMKRFYRVLCVLAIFELPRYLSMAVQESYSCTVCYAFHILADTSYFACLALVSITFAHILELGPYISLLYSKRGLMIALLLVTLVNFIAFVDCSTYTNLYSFFQSPIYLFFTIFDMIQNVTYSAFLAFYGVKLITRFTNLKQNTSDHLQKETFIIVLYKVTCILSIITFFSSIRLAILITKIVSIENDGVSVSTRIFSLYGFLWFMLSDFFPRGLNVILMSFVMQSRDVNIASNGKDRQSNADSLPLTNLTSNNPINTNSPPDHKNTHWNGNKKSEVLSNIEVNPTTRSSTNSDWLLVDHTSNYKKSSKFAKRLPTETDAVTEDSEVYNTRDQSVASNLNVISEGSTPIVEMEENPQDGTDEVMEDEDDDDPEFIGSSKYIMHSKVYDEEYGGDDDE